MRKTLCLLGCAVRLLAAGFTRNWEAYDNVCAEVDRIHAAAD